MRSFAPTETHPPEPALARRAAASPIVRQALASPARPLDAETRAFMEPRFGHDFSHVRIHADERANASASAVDAYAYTVGEDIVVEDSRFDSRTAEGYQLLDHELAHVVEQSGQPPRLQRWAHCTPARLSLEECPPRESGEVARARTSPMVFFGRLNDPGSGARGVLISNFDIGSDRIKPSLPSTIYWQQFLDQVVANGSQLNILGFTDCEGAQAGNERIREARANAVYDILPPAVKSLVLSRAGAPIQDCITENSNAAERTLNRSVALVWAGSSVVTFEEDERVEAEVPKFVCGPDVTAEVSAAVAGIDTAFAGWSSGQKEDACDALDSVTTGACAWDIVQLHNNAWIHKGYRPTCATAGASPGCGDSVQVGSECYYAGSANYVIFGKMCRLCANYYLSIPLINTGYARFTRSAMDQLIDIYKGSGVTGLATPAGNFRESVAWANAGYDGWPSGGTPPAGDRSHCRPVCPTPYRGGSFTVEWAPNQDPYGCSR
jgi:outer membrane protein OmpA-like peptidoglycan-associated protein